MGKSYYAVLGVKTDATTDEIRSAYRRLAKKFHPDYCSEGSENFHEIHEAYSVLADMHRRRDYDNRVMNSRRINVRQRCRPRGFSRPEPEPLIPESAPESVEAISPAGFFETFAFFFDSIFDLNRRNRFASERIQNLTIEVPLSSEQAAVGGSARIAVPVETACRMCGGYGEIGLFECSLCAGSGISTGEVPVIIGFPPGLSSDHTVRVPLSRFGVRNIVLTVVFRPIDH
ncbi:MAG: DnaJ domain-containing protein [Desulfobacterales bacterium]